MKMTFGLVAVAVLLTGSPVVASPLKHHGIRGPACKCYTDQPSCKGQAEFYGTSQKTCSISGHPQSCFVHSSVSGDSRIFLYQDGISSSVMVGYGDTVACVPGVNGVPIGTPMHRIGVRK